MNFKIKEIRILKGWTLEYLSVRTGISKSHLQRIENNETMPAYDKVCDIAHVLNVSLDEVAEYCYTENPQH